MDTDNWERKEMTSIKILNIIYTGNTGRKTVSDSEIEIINPSSNSVHSHYQILGFYINPLFFFEL